MRKDITITAEPRETRGKNEARRLRVRGLVPGDRLRRGRKTPFDCDQPEGSTTILRSARVTTRFSTSIFKAEAPVMIVDWQHEPIKGKLLHVDLKRIDLSKRVIVKVPVHTHGDPWA